LNDDIGSTAPGGWQGFGTELAMCYDGGMIIDAIPGWVFYLFAVILGAILGSFANVHSQDAARRIHSQASVALP